MPDRVLGELGARIARCGLSAVVAPALVADMRDLPDQSAGVVGRGIVYNDDLLVDVGLREHRVNCLLQISGCPVIGGNDDANLGHSDEFLGRMLKQSASRILASFAVALMDGLF